MSEQVLTIQPAAKSHVQIKSRTTSAQRYWCEHACSLHMHAELVLLHSVRWKYAARSAIRHLRCRCVCGLDSALVVVDPCTSKPMNHAYDTHRPHNRRNNQVETLDKIHSAVTPIFVLSLALYFVNLFLIFP